MPTTRCYLAVAMVVLVVGAGAQKQDCTSSYTYLAPCLSYASGTDAAPSLQCCSGISYLNSNDADCLCQVVTQFNSSSTTSSVNATRAFALPRLCGVAVDSAKCPALALAPGAAIVAPTPPSSPSTSAAAAPHVISFTARALGAVFVVTHFVWNAT